MVSRRYFLRKCYHFAGPTISFRRLHHLSLVIPPKFSLPNRHTHRTNVFLHSAVVEYRLRHRFSCHRRKTTTLSHLYLMLSSCQDEVDTIHTTCHRITAIMHNTTEKKIAFLVSSSQAPTRIAVIVFFFYFFFLLCVNIGNTCFSSFFFGNPSVSSV